MRVILLRHGNTFDPGSKAVWVGRGEDLPLVEKGVVQAHQVAGVLSELGLLADALYCSSLQRTRMFAEILKADCKWKTRIVEDQRLDELDYGNWAGLTSEEIAARGWVVDLQQWNDRCVWPESGDWDGSPELIRSEVEDFVKDLRTLYDKEATVVAVTSNGRLKFFLSLDTESYRQALAKERVKVKTGHGVVLDIDAEKVKVVGWNLRPEELAALISKRSVI